MSAPDLTTSCVVIGAGQAGLSVAFYLRRLGLEPGEEFVVLDRGPRTGGAWQHRWEALRLGSAHRVNDLPGMDELGLSFGTADHHAPARDVVADYYAQYEEHYGLQVVRPALVTRVEDLGGPLLVRFDTENGPLELAGSTIVNATGTWGSPFVPHYPGIRAFEGRHVHTADYTDATDFADQDVVVVGPVRARSGSSSSWSRTRAASRGRRGGRPSSSTRPCSTWRPPRRPSRRRMTLRVPVAPCRAS